MVSFNCFSSAASTSAFSRRNHGDADHGVSGRPGRADAPSCASPSWAAFLDSTAGHFTVRSGPEDHGRGLALVSQLAHRWGVGELGASPRAKEVWFELMA